MAIDGSGNWYPLLPDGPGLSAISGEWTSGAGVPGNGIGNNGDGYLNITTGDVYVKHGDVWTIIQGGGGTEVTHGSGPPVAAPANPASAAIYYDDDSGSASYGVVWTWNVNTQQWIT